MEAGDCQGVLRTPDRRKNVHEDVQIKTSTGSACWTRQGRVHSLNAWALGHATVGGLPSHG